MRERAVHFGQLRQPTLLDGLVERGIELATPASAKVGGLPFRQTFREEPGHTALGETDVEDVAELVPQGHAEVGGSASRTHGGELASEAHPSDADVRQPAGAHGEVLA